ncbi:MAG: hypothetical protein ACRDBG_26010 [Waterburya sp.]
MAYTTAAKILVNKMANALLDDRIKKPIGQLEYQYEDGDYSGLPYITNVEVLEDERDIETAYEVLVKVSPEIYEILQSETVFSIEDIMAAQAKLEAEQIEYADVEDDTDDDDDVEDEDDADESMDENEIEYSDEIDDEILMLRDIIEESYRSGIDGLFTLDLEPIGADNNYLFDEDTNSFEGVFTDGDKIFTFEVVDPTGNDDWELSYIDATEDYS